MNGLPTDADELLVAVQAGQTQRLGELLERYRGYLRVLARVQIGRRLQGKVDASDVVQETFLEAQRDFPRFAGSTEKELVGWLRTILGSNLADLVRHYGGTKKRDLRLERELEADLDQSSRAFGQVLVARDNSPSQSAARREQSVLVLSALDRMPADYREVLILRHLEGLSFPEVAGRMGRSLDSVKNLWARALDRLRRTLEGVS